MIITDRLFEAFLHCPTKCFLRARGEAPTGNVYGDWSREQSESFRNEGAAMLLRRFPSFAPVGTLLDSPHVTSDNWRCAVDVLARSQNLESHIHSVERIPAQGAAPPQLVPLRFVRANRPNNL